MLELDQAPDFHFCALCQQVNSRSQSKGSEAASRILLFSSSHNSRSQPSLSVFSHAQRGRQSSQHLLPPSQASMRKSPDAGSTQSQMRPGSSRRKFVIFLSGTTSPCTLADSCALLEH